MNKKTFKLEPNHNIPFEIEIQQDQHDTNALIKIIKEQNCKSLAIRLTNSQGDISRYLPAKPFNQLHIGGYQKFSVEAEFVSAADSFIELDVYMGTWEEMILVEMELSFSASPFYISCHQDQIEFMIGEPGESTMTVTPHPDKSFSVTTTIIQGATQTQTVQNTIAENRPGNEVIRRLYGRIKGRVNGVGFAERQEDNKRRYAENLDATLMEGFHPQKEGVK